MINLLEETIDCIKENNQSEEYRDGVGQYTSAIVELEDGTVKNLPLELIKFDDK